MTPGEVLEFWLSEGEAKWYAGGAAFDTLCHEKLGAAAAAAREGALEHWRDGPDGVLAYLILTDQIPRNIYRGDALSFASDWRALGAAGEAILFDWDLMVPVPQRQFFYLPFMHAEDLVRQDAGIRFFATRMPSADNHLHARTHREVIRRFGRFPYRNAALGRQTTEAEAAFLADGGYRAALRDMTRLHGPIPAG